MNNQTIIIILAFLTLISNFFVVILIIIYVISRRKGLFFDKTKGIYKNISLNYERLALIISLTAASGSLFLSEVAGFTPCKLCWFQRIFMYPLPIVLGISIWKKYKDSFRYVLPLSLIGLVVAIYHYYLQISYNPFIPCSTVGFSISCSDRFFTYYGYITIPWMSLSAFLYIFLLGVYKKIS